MLIKKSLFTILRFFLILKLCSISEKNIFIGENETGKSTLLLALDLTLSGSYSKIENMGLETLFNNNAIDTFFNSNRGYEELPKLSVEIFLKIQIFSI